MIRSKTLQDYMALPQEHGVELIEGEFVMSPSPGVRHQRIVLHLSFALHDLMRRTRQGEVFVAPMDVVLTPETVLQPDLLIVLKGREGIVKERIEGAPDVVIEILSPATTDRDRRVKRRLYARNGVREYWIVDPDARTVDVLALRGKGYRLIAAFKEKDALKTPILPELDLDLSALWC